MKIIQRLEIGDTTYVFTENPEEDVKAIQELYENEDRDCYLGYELPVVTDFEFLGNKYKAISFWHDNEDAKEIDLTQLQANDKSV